MGVDELIHSPADPGLSPEPSVLLVEDDHDVARTQQRFIERAGMRTAWASTGAEAQRLKESFRPDIVLVDLGLPDMDGSNLVRWLTAVLGPWRERHQGNPVLELMHGGRWLGHPLHPALSDLPIGLWTGALILDLTDRDPASRPGIEPAALFSAAGIAAAVAT